MPSLDISRESFQRRKNYSDLRQQQGRVPLDSELNEGSDIQSEELRRAIQDIICSAGTPDDGFRVSYDSMGAAGAYEFNLDKGTYYIGGRRYDCLNATTFLTQPDWMQITHDLTPAPAVPAAERFDFVYLEGWEQDVTATEDSELFERALVGADGAGRRRRMARVHVVEDTASECIDAMQALFPDDMFDDDTGGLISGAGLTVDFDDTYVEENLCAPAVQAGYLGAENETFRVQLTAPDRYIYGRDNASQLYRVTLEQDPDDASRTRVTFITQPRSVHAHPLAGQAVEILRWNTALPNGEKLAEPLGVLGNINSDFNPEDSTLIVDLDFTTINVDWAGTPVADQFFYLRVWTGGSGATPADHQIADSTATILPGTGLTAAFATAPDGSFGMAGDYWVIAARPNAPDIVTPWSLMDAFPDTPAPPTGPLRHIAPLAILHWNNSPTSGNMEPTVQDCRRRFRKLCSVPTCCEVTVGDGQNSHGDTNSIADAISRLPASGGKICLLRGTFTESVAITGRSDITFSGCGSETTWSAEPGTPALTLTDCHRIKFNDFRMQAQNTDVVLAGSRTGPTPGGETSSELHFDKIAFQGADQTALWLNDCDDTRLIQCRVEMAALSAPRSTDPLSGTDPALFLMGDGITVRDCWVGITPDDMPPVETRPMGGIQIGGLSRNVLIQSNQIITGKGNGITLGHLEWTDADDGTVGPSWGLGFGFYINDAGCFVPWPDPIPPADFPGGNPVPDSAGEIQHLRIEDNLIQDMGLNGIAVCSFFDLNQLDVMISLVDTRIERNQIAGCLASALEAPDPAASYFQSFGGITLAACDLLHIRDNRIHDNAPGSVAPVCGIFVLFGSGLEIDDNHIFTNGAAGGDSVGRRGGVNIGWCLSYLDPVSDRETRATPARRAALSMSGNFIDSPNGQALKTVALGPVQITDNQMIGTARDPGLIFQQIGAIFTFLPPFTSIGTALTSLAISSRLPREEFANAEMLLAELMIAAMGGSAISVFNAAWFEEFSDILDADAAQSSGLLPVGGETMFNDNQVTLLPEPGRATYRVSSVLVASMDDVAMTANQVEINRGVGRVLSNAFTPAATVRMTSNRMQEPVGTCLFSGMSHSVLLNTQALNQGTHCFGATALLQSIGHFVEQGANLSLVDSLIGSFSDVRYCGLLQKSLDALAGGTDDDLFPGTDETDTTDPTGGTGPTGDTGTTDTTNGTHIPDTTDGTGPPDPADDKLKMPRLLCNNEPLARATISAAQLILQEEDIAFVHVPGATEPMVLGQSPTAGSDIQPGEKVALVIGVNNSQYPMRQKMLRRYKRCLSLETNSKQPGKKNLRPTEPMGNYQLGGYAYLSDYLKG